MELSDDARRLLNLRYCRGNEHPEDVYGRVAKALGAPDGMEEEFFKIMDENRFLPCSPCLRNAGFENFNKACYVFPVEDTMEGIFKTLKDAAMTFKSGGGCGYNFSDLRQKDAPLSSGGSSSGVLSFIKIYDSITEAIKQGGFRRGASLGVLEPDHPEILDFVKSKLVPGTLTNFNISVLVTNEFMEKVSTDEYLYLRDRLDKRKTIGKIKYTDLFSIICFSAWLTADPGLLFFDRINKDNPVYPKYPIRAANPCSEEPMLPYESCTLGSINLSEHVENNELDLDKLKESAEIGTRFLLQINKYCEYPVKECALVAAKTNRIGLGIMGFSDMLLKMNIKYDSQDTLNIIDKIWRILKTEAKRIAYNSYSVLTIAPTGSLSILASCSPSIEPIYSKDYERRVVAGTFRESRENTEYLRTAHEILPEWHLKIQSKVQEYVDGGVSKTVNLPYEASIQDIKDIYIKAWKSGCKGITVYRDRSKDTQVYYDISKKCNGETCYL